MTLRLSTRIEHNTLAIGMFRPITLTLTCDAAGLFCETFEREGDERNGTGCCDRHGNGFGPRVMIGKSESANGRKNGQEDHLQTRPCASA
jgi:hypothetical protein